MKKFLFILLFLFAASAYAETESYNGWVYSGSYFEFNNINYQLYVSGNAESILLNSGQISQKILLNSCLEEGQTKLCYNNSLYDRDKGIYKVLLYSYFVSPELKVTRTLTQNILEVGETANFEAVIENTGDIDANDVVFNESFPNNIVIESVSNGEKIGNTVYWKGNLEKGDSREIRYRIKALGDVDQYVKASVKYPDGNNFKEIFSNSVRLYSSPILVITLSTNKEDYELNEDISFNITIENNGEKRVTINDLKIMFPEGIIIDAMDRDFEKKGDYYVWSGKLEDGDTEVLEFTLLGKKTGASFINMIGSYDYDGNTYEMSQKIIGFVLHDEGIELSSSLDSTTYANSGQVINLFVRVWNKNSYSVIKDLVLNTETDIAHIDTVRYNTLGENSTAQLLNNPIRAPDETGEKTYNIRFNLTYKSEDGEPGSAILDKKIIVRPQNTLKVLPSLSSTSVIEETEMTITLDIENPGQEDLNNIYITTEIPNAFSVIGQRSGYADSNKSSKQRVLSFKIRPGLVNAETKYNLTFNANYVYKDVEYRVTETKLVTVTPKVPSVSLSRTLSKSTPYQGEYLDITYEIVNNDVLPIYDLFLTASESKDFDSIGFSNYSVSHLNPGEKVTFAGEQIRPKLKGATELGLSMLTFKDKYKRQFSKNASIDYISVKEADISGPCVLVETSLSSDTLDIGENAVLLINLTNLGSSIAVGRFNNQELRIPFKESRLFESNISFSEYGTQIIPRVSFYYDNLEKETRAYSDPIYVDVINKSAPPSETTKTEEVTEVSDNITVEEKKPTLFSRVITWFKGLFKKV